MKLVARGSIISRAFVGGQTQPPGGRIHTAWVYVVKRPGRGTITQCERSPGISGCGYPDCNCKF